MKPPGPTPLMAILAGSLALNLGFVAYHVQAGTFRRVLLRADLVQSSAERTSFQSSMEARYRKLSTASGGVVFAGDSLIFQGPWSEFYSDIRNRGIPNETSALLLARLGDITGTRPRNLILLVGTNDFSQGVPVAQLVRNYRSILEKLRDESPSTGVTVMGLLPVRPGLPMAGRRENPTIGEVNRRLEALTREFPSARFLDLTSQLADDSGQLRREFTEDGLHLTLDGYLAIRDAVRSRLEDTDPDPR